MEQIRVDEVDVVERGPLLNWDRLEEIAKKRVPDQSEEAMEVTKEDDVGVQGQEAMAGLGSMETDGDREAIQKEMERASLEHMDLGDDLPKQILPNKLIESPRISKGKVKKPKKHLRDVLKSKIPMYARSFGIYTPQPKKSRKVPGWITSEF